MAWTILNKHSSLHKKWRPHDLWDPRLWVKYFTKAEMDFFFYFQRTRNAIAYCL